MEAPPINRRDCRGYYLKVRVGLKTEKLISYIS